MTCRRLRAILLALSIAIFVISVLSLFQPTTLANVASVCICIIAEALLVFAFLTVRGGESTKPDTVRVLKQRTSCFGAIAESLAVEANALSTDFTAFADRMKIKILNEKGPVDAVEKLLNQLTVLSDLTASTDKCLTQLQVLTKISPLDSAHQHRPFSNTFSRSYEPDERNRYSSHRSDPGSNHDQLTTTLLKQFAAINILMQSVSRAAAELRLAQQSLLSSSENLVDGLSDRVARSEQVSLSAQRVAAIFREVDFVLDLALQDNPLLPAKMTAGNRVESGHLNSGKHLALKTLPGGELDRRQIVEIR